MTRNRLRQFLGRQQRVQRQLPRFEAWSSWIPWFVLIVGAVFATLIGYPSWLFASMVLLCVVFAWFEDR